MSLNSDWFKKVRLSKDFLTYLDELLFRTSKFCGWPFLNHWKLRDIMYLIFDFKGLIYVKVDLEAQGHDSSFTICHSLLKKDILHLKRY